VKYTRIILKGATDIHLPFIGNPSHKFLLKAADGLGPPEIDVNINPTLFAGGVYLGRRPQGREVVLRVGLKPGYATGPTAADLRTELYGLLTGGTTDLVTLQIVNGNQAGAPILAYTDGYIKRIEINPFSKEPEVQITLSCLQPYLLHPVNISQNNATLSKSAPSFTNLGTASAGLYILVNFTAATSDWSITNGRGEKVRLLGWNFGIGDKLAIDTRDGLRNMTYFQTNGNVKNVVQYLTLDSQWFQLHTGVNTFTTSHQNFNWENFMYRPRYWGV
jgi:hypothetical protein